MGVRNAFQRLFGAPTPGDDAAGSAPAAPAGAETFPNYGSYAPPAAVLYGQPAVAPWAQPAHSVPAAPVEPAPAAPSPGYAAEAAPAPVEPATPREPLAGPGEVVYGTAELRTAAPELPNFYVPPDPPQPPPPPVSSFPAGQSTYDPTLVKEAFGFVSDRADQLVANFYAELFLRVREAPMMFPSSMTRQRQEFGKAVVQWVVADDPDALTAHLHQLGADHRKFDVDPRHYEIAGAAMVSAWKHLAGDRWTDEHEAAIVGSYTRLASTMIDGALKRQNEPAWWGAQVVEHTRVGSDLAVIRIQPDMPYPYRAGQYVTLELPSHRREWRSMSIASAPRRDNTFDINVRALGAAGVSAALVRFTQVGHRLRLGPPRGNDLVVEPGTVPNGLLCIAEGTGAAPIMAVVEAALLWPEAPQLYMYVGGRTRDDMYWVDRTNQLIHQTGRWGSAQAHAVLSEDSAYTGYHGRVDEVVPALRDWAELGVDVLVAGPNSMIATTVTTLADAGVPMSRIHFDQFEMGS